jgi:hypothetical protein
MAMGRIVQSRPGRACRGPSRQGARPGRRGRRGENPRHLVDPAEVGAADEKSLDALLPVLYLRGVSTGAFQEVLTALLGKDAPNLSPAVTTRLTAEWQADYDAWQKRDLSARRYSQRSAPLFSRYGF